MHGYMNKKDSHKTGNEFVQLIKEINNNIYEFRS